MVCLVINGKELPHKEILIQHLQCIEGMTSIVLNINREKTNVILGNQKSCDMGKRIYCG